jgi:hypothetical protein
VSAAKPIKVVFCLNDKCSGVWAMANLAYARGLADEAEQIDDGLPPGSVLYEGQFQITRLVRRGDGGAVYGAKDSLGRDVFLKLCPETFVCQAETTEDDQTDEAATSWVRRPGFVLQEAHCLSDWDHPNIVSFDQSLEAAVSGQAVTPLSDRLMDAAKRPELHEIPAIARKMLGALRSIHEQGRLHGQILPQNILLTETGEPFLIDFGSASQFAVDTCCTPADPEDENDDSLQIEAETGLEVWKDLRDLGATLRAAIASGASLVDQSRLNTSPETRADGHALLAGRHEGYPPGFLESIDKVVLALPEDRFETADEWLEVLDRGASDEEARMKLLGRTIGLRRTAQNTEKREDPTPAVVQEDVVVGDKEPQPDAGGEIGKAGETGLQKKTTSMPKLYLEGNKMSVDLSGLKEISGFISGCLVDCESGLMLASESVGKFDIETAAAANVDVVRGKQTAIRLLGLNDKIEDILISLGTQLHLIRPLEKMPTMFLYAALDRKTANLGMARLQVKKVEQGIKL